MSISSLGILAGFLAGGSGLLYVRFRATIARGRGPALPPDCPSSPPPRPIPQSNVTLVQHTGVTWSTWSRSVVIDGRAGRL